MKPFPNVNPGNGWIGQGFDFAVRAKRSTIPRYLRFRFSPLRAPGFDRVVPSPRAIATYASLIYGGNLSRTLTLPSTPHAAFPHHQPGFGIEIDDRQLQTGTHFPRRLWPAFDSKKKDSHSDYASTCNQHKPTRNHPTTRLG
jgi:hypothetical protein